jgi:triphosphatase
VNGHLRRRQEITQRLQGADDTLLGVAGPVGDRIRALCGPRPLVPLFEIRTSRRIFHVRAGESAAEVAVDRTTIPAANGQGPSRLGRVEVEVEHGSPVDLAPFVEELETVPGLRPAAHTKFDTALRVLGVAVPGPPDVGPTETARSQTAGDLAFAVLRRHFHALLEAEPGARMGEDPERVHDARVAIRRLRAVMSIYREALPARIARLRSELAWIGDALGAVRDLDLQLERVRAWIEDGIESEGGSEVVALLEGSRATAREELLRGLHSDRFSRLAVDLAGFLRKGPLRAQRVAWQPITGVAPELIEARRRAVQKALRQLRAGSHDDAGVLHRVRIRCKRLRYCLESLADVYPQEVADAIPELVKVQDRLGEHQDAVVGARHLRELASGHGDELTPVALFVLGQMAQRYEQEARRSVRRFSKRPSPIAGPEWKRLLKAAGKLQDRGAEAPRVPVPEQAAAEAEPVQVAFEV